MQDMYVISNSDQLYEILAIKNTFFIILSSSVTANENVLLGNNDIEELKRSS